MKKIVICLCFCALIVSLITACTLEDDNTLITCEMLRDDLESLRVSIRDLAATSVCGPDFECNVIGFGAKPCGGYWEYLIYTTSINTDALETLVTDFNMQENDFNQNCGAASDCSIPSAPTGFTCENNVCIPVF